MAFNSETVMLLVDDPRFQLAMQLMDRGLLSAAIERLTELNERLSPGERVVALYWRIYCFIGLGDVLQARTSLDEAFMQVGANQGLIICLKLASAITLGIDRPGEAAGEIGSLLKLYAHQLEDPGFKWTYAYAKTCLGIYLSRSDKYLEASAALEEALSLEGRPLDRYMERMYLGDIYYKLGDFEKARDHFEVALLELDAIPKADIPPDYIVQPQYELALIAYKRHRFDEARRQLDLASAVAVQSPNLEKVITRLRALLESDAQPQGDSD